MARDIENDADRLIETVAGGGVALFPVDVGYAIVGNREAAIERIFAAKQRSYDKPCGMFSNWAMFLDIAAVGQSERDMVDAVIHRHKLPLSVVVPYKIDHPHFAGLTARTRAISSRAGTIDMLLNAGTLHDAIAQRSFAQRLPVLGSSANMSLTGSKYRFADVEEPVRRAADFVLDYGDTKYSHPEGMGSTIIELPSGRPLRKGIVYDAICDILAQDFGVDPRKLG
jgi:tRNA A37 threonylcarbamoyladenosine synthetase subunit TsaC/SUA5/YrdC